MHDMKGVPIYPGDLLRSFHFVGMRRKVHFLYHVAVADGAGMRMVPTCHLEPTKRAGGGETALSKGMAAACEVIHGHGPGDILSFEDRPRVVTEVNS